MVNKECVVVGVETGELIRGGKGGLLWETLFEEGKRWKNEKESWEMAMVGSNMKADAKSRGPSTRGYR